MFLFYAFKKSVLIRSPQDSPDHPRGQSIVQMTKNLAEAGGGKEDVVGIQEPSGSNLHYSMIIINKAPLKYSPHVRHCCKCFVHVKCI